MAKKIKAKVRAPSSRPPRMRSGHGRNPFTLKAFGNRIERLGAKRARYRSRLRDPERAATAEERARIERRNLGYERAIARVGAEIAATRVKGVR